MTLHRAHLSPAPWLISVIMMISFNLQLYKLYITPQSVLEWMVRPITGIMMTMTIMMRQRGCFCCMLHQQRHV